MSTNGEEIGSFLDIRTNVVAKTYHRHSYQITDFLERLKHTKRLTLLFKPETLSIGIRMSGMRVSLIEVADLLEVALP